MNATPLFLQDGKPAGIYFCGQCRHVHASEYLATNCCVPPTCSACGQPAPRYHTLCDSCRNAQRIQKEAERFEKAEKITAWSGPVYCDGIGYNDGYFENLAELEDYLGDNPQEIPGYVWTCHSKKFCQLDYHRILSNQLEGAAYDDWDEDSVKGEAELKAAIDVFNGLNSEHVVWTPNYKVALLVPELV